VNTLKAFGRFWYDFIIGDDWKIAVAVVSALTVVTLLLVGTSIGDHLLAVLGGAIIVVAFAISLAIDTRPRRTK
jgi:asparagine N-glycosylation enzyme membrane subunit Stt3